MSPLPNLEEREHEAHELEKEMAKPNWAITVENWQQLGLAISTFNAAIGNFCFVGTAEQSIEDRVVVLRIELYHQMEYCAPKNVVGERCGTPICPNCHGVPF